MKHEQLTAEKRRMSIRMALEWSFQTECAWLSLDDGEAEAPAGVDTLYRLIKRHELGGMFIQGGGQSDPHPDADLIGAAVTGLAVNSGNIGLALTIVELARMGKAPDWMEGAVAQIEPIKWRKRTFRSKVQMGEEEVLQKHTILERRPNPRRPGEFRIQRRVYTVKHVPIRWTIHPDEIRRARRRYLAWIDGLAILRDKLIEDGQLDTIELTDRLPVRRPWVIRIDPTVHEASELRPD